jgi:hypothetical protein
LQTLACAPQNPLPDESSHQNVLAIVHKMRLEIPCEVRFPSGRSFEDRTVPISKLVVQDKAGYPSTLRGTRSSERPKRSTTWPPSFLPWTTFWRIQHLQVPIFDITLLRLFKDRGL